jgi:competence protein ComEC
MFRWTPYPMVRLAIFLGTGICCHLVFGLTDLSFKALLYIIIFSTLLYYYAIIKNQKLLSGLLGGVIFICCGVVLTDEKKDTKSDLHLIHFEHKTQAFQAIIIEPAEKTKAGFRIKIRIVKVRDSAKWYNYFSDCMLYVRQFSPDLRQGNKILVKGTPIKIKSNSDRVHGNSTKRIVEQNIFFKVFSKNHEIQKIPESPGIVKNPISDFRQYIVAVIEKYVSGIDQQAITQALLIGKSDLLPAELRNAYAASGTMHVLAVSGLHVGIIYWIILFFLKPLSKFANGRWIIALLSILILWLYAVLTGLSASVLRAVVMFSFVAISNPFGLRSQIINTLAGSLFILLVHNPMLLLNVGFQLSYLAVAGIIWIHPILKSNFKPEYPMVDYCWNIVSVSIAAQLTTFPLTLYYFHRFPIYFIPANLIIIPLSFLLLICCLLLIAVGTIPSFGIWTGYIIESGIRLMNFFARAFEALPGQLPDGIYLTEFQVFVLMTINLFTISMFLYRKRQLFYPAFVFALIFSISDIIGYN